MIAIYRRFLDEFGMKQILIIKWENVTLKEFYGLMTG